MVDFKPSQVRLVGAVPLGDTFGKAEYEVTVAAIVLALQKTGDAWRPISSVELADEVRKAASSYHWLTNPFLALDIAGLVTAGYLLVDGEPGRLTCELSGECIERLAKWVRS